MRAARARSICLSPNETVSVSCWRKTRGPMTDATCSTRRSAAPREARRLATTPRRVLGTSARTDSRRHDATPSRTVTAPASTKALRYSSRARGFPAARAQSSSRRSGGGAAVRERVCMTSARLSSSSRGVRWITAREARSSQGRGRPPRPLKSTTTRARGALRMRSSTRVAERSSMCSAASQAKTVIWSSPRRVAILRRAVRSGRDAESRLSMLALTTPRTTPTASISSGVSPSSRTRRAFSRMAASPSPSTMPRSSRSSTCRPESGTSRSWVTQVARFQVTGWFMRRRR